MASRKLLTNVLRGFLGTYVSRYSDLDGYLVFGLSVGSLDALEVDLMGERPPASLDPASEVRRLAIVRFTQQLAKAGLPRSVVASAKLTVRAAHALEHSVGAWHGAPSGRTYTFTAVATTDLGRAFCAECRAFIAPYAEGVFVRSTRRGSISAEEPIVPQASSTASGERGPLRP